MENHNFLQRINKIENVKEDKGDNTIQIVKRKICQFEMNWFKYENL